MKILFILPGSLAPIGGHSVKGTPYFVDLADDLSIFVKYFLAIDRLQETDILNAESAAPREKG